jgi:hypothetical protein
VRQCGAERGCEAVRVRPCGTVRGCEGEAVRRNEAL